MSKKELIRKDKKTPSKTRHKHKFMYTSLRRRTPVPWDDDVTSAKTSQLLGRYDDMISCNPSNTSQTAADYNSFQRKNNKDSSLKKIPISKSEMEMQRPKKKLRRQVKIYDHREERKPYFRFEDYITDEPDSFSGESLVDDPLGSLHKKDRKSNTWLEKSITVEQQKHDKLINELECKKIREMKDFTKYRLRPKKERKDNKVKVPKYKKPDLRNLGSRIEKYFGGFANHIDDWIRNAELSSDSSDLDNSEPNLCSLATLPPLSSHYRQPLNLITIKNDSSVEMNFENGKMKKVKKKSKKKKRRRTEPN